MGTVLHCWRGGGGWPEGCQSRHIRINPMFNCVIFVKVCDFAEIKSIQNKKMPVEDLIMSHLQSEEEFIEQLSSHFKLCIAVNFKSHMLRSFAQYRLSLAK